MKSNENGRLFASEAADNPVMPVLPARGKVGLFASEAATNPFRELKDSGKFSENALQFNPYEVALRKRFTRVFEILKRMEINFVETSDEQGIE